MARDVVAGNGELRGSPRDRALAGFAHILTEAPWAVDADDIQHLQHLQKDGLSEAEIEQAILVVAFFNYFPRVADATGIEFDYESPLPRLVADSNRDALPRIPVADWNLAVDGSTLPLFAHAPQITELLTPWRVLHMEREAPMKPSTRRLLVRIVTQELCDAAAVRHWPDGRPTNDNEVLLVAFARKLTRTPWAMNEGDVFALRSAGLSDEAILGAITLIAHQNAISRMHHGLAAMRSERGRQLDKPEVLE